MKKLFLRFFSNNVLAKRRGMAMPAALMFTMAITALAAIFSQVATQGLATASRSNATADTFEMAEGAAHDLLRQIVFSPHLWREKTPLATLPSGYTEYDPASFSSTNGIPTCTGLGCERNRYPTSGGFIKNYGPIGGDGDSVDSSRAITNQLDHSDLPDQDLALNGRPTWTQVERLDETLPSSSTLGADLSNNPTAGGGANVIRFRITGTSVRSLKGDIGDASVVVIAEVPNA